MPESVYLVSTVALGVSIIFGLSNHIQHIALQHMDVRSGTIVIVASGFAMLLALSPTFLEPAVLFTPAVGWFALAGLIVPSLSMTLHTLAVRQLGPAITSALTSTSPVFAIALALTVLGEVGDARLFTGTAIVIGGIAFIALRSRQMRATWPLWALLVPLGAALSRALSHNVIKVGLNDLPSPMTAALVGSTVSVIILTLWHRASASTMPRWNRGYYWFGLCGLLNGIGLVGLNMALQLGTVTLVAPLISTTPVFTLLLGWMFFRKESVGWPTVFAISAIFSGCLLIILR